MTVASIGTPAMTRATSGSITATWGSGQSRTVGDLLIALVTAGGSTASAAAISTPSGWTQADTIGNTTTSAHAWVAVYTKVAAGGDSAPSFTATLSGTVAMTATMVELDAAAVIVPVDATGTYSSGSGSGSLTAMTVTAGTPVSTTGGYAVTVYAQEAAAATNTWNPGGGWSNAANDGSTNTVLHSAVDVQAGPTILTAATETAHWTTNGSAYGAAIVLVVAAVSGGLEGYVNDGSTTISSGGTTAPAAGTAEFWTAASWSSFPAAASTTAPPVRFHVADPAAPSEVIAVLDTTSGLVIRGSGSTTPVSHTGGFTVVNVLNATQSGNVAQTYNVRQFGATGNGSTDDATALQAALTACRLAGGGTVHVPAGTYITSQILQIGSNTTLKGDGRGVTTIRAIASMDPVQIGNLAGITVLQVWAEQPATDIIVEDITFDGNEAGNTSIPGPFSSGFSACIRLDQVDRLTIRNVEVVNAILYSIWLNACTNFEVSGCRILSGQDNSESYNDQDGIHVTNSQNGVISGNLVDTGTFYSPTVGDDAVCLQSLTTAAGGGAATGGGGPSPCSNISVTGNVLRSATRGVSILMGGSAGSNFTIAGNTIWTTGSPWVIIAADIATASPTTGVTITGNTLAAGDAGNGGYGIQLMPNGASGNSQGWADVTITGNTFPTLTTPTGNPGIFAVFGTGLVISGNVMDNWTGNVGIQVGGSAGPGSQPVTDFTINGNVLNMSASSETDPIGILLLNSSVGSVTGNTIASSTQAGSVGLLLKGQDVATLGIAVSGNRVGGWATAILESNAGAQPDYNSVVGNNTHGCTAFITTSGSHDVVASNVVA